MMAILMSVSLSTMAGCAGHEKWNCAELRTPSGHAIIMQSGPHDGKTFIRKQVGPGYSILEQRSGGNSAVVIQQDDGSD